MKKNILLLFILVCCIAVKAQIPNPGFENWTTVGSYETPDNWGNMNSLTASASVFTCEKGTPSNQGLYCVKLTTKTGSSGIVPAIITSGELNQISYKPISGFPYTQRPISLKGSRVFMAYGSDHGFMEVTLTRWNPSAHQHDTISHTRLDLPGLPAMEMSWTAFTLPLVYQAAGNPDTAFLTFSASADHPIPNSYLWLDALQFELPAGIDKPGMADVYQVFPNPSQGLIKIETGTRSSDHVLFQLFDDKGSLLKEQKTQYAAGHTSLDFHCDDVTPGVYFLHITSNGKTTTHKVILE